ncbi:hypothetical protein COCNU_scaffold013531G000010 [Cocos nucifera]|nr:hypothetical protein [Cocos nucifera]
MALMASSDGARVRAQAFGAGGASAGVWVDENLPAGGRRLSKGRLLSAGGLEILAFPCNQFGAQEPGTKEQILEFACTRFKAEYPIFDKVEVNGNNVAPIYKFLKSRKGSLFGNSIKWNFTKFLVDKEGRVVDRYAPTTSPLSFELGLDLFPFMFKLKKSSANNLLCTMEWQVIGQGQNMYVMPNIFMPIKMILKSLPLEINLWWGKVTEQDLALNETDEGLEILAFPCNQFGAQEPGTKEQILEFACTRFKAEYPIFDKVEVNGNNVAPIYKFLKSRKGSLFGNSIKWNFTKFLVDKEGRVVDRYAPTTSPLSFEKKIKKLLGLV